jgi:hypothetical protein
MFFRKGVAKKTANPMPESLAQTSRYHEDFLGYAEWNFANMLPKATV